MFLQLPKNGQKQGALTLVKGGLDFGGEDDVRIPDELVCRCECGEEVLVPTAQWINGSAREEFGECVHCGIVKQGCYTAVNPFEDGELVKVRCECGFEGETFTREEWDSKAVGASFQHCPHGIVGERQGCLTADCVKDCDMLFCRCTCGMLVTVPIEDWHAGRVAKSEKYSACWHR